MISARSVSTGGATVPHLGDQIRGNTIKNEHYARSQKTEFANRSEEPNGAPLLYRRVYMGGRFRTLTAGALLSGKSAYIRRGNRGGDGLVAVARAN